MSVEIKIIPREKEYNTLLETYPPQLTNKFLPDWYKKQKYAHLSKGFGTEDTENHIPKTTKNCPAIREYVTDGITIPAWTDLICVKQDDKWSWNLSVQNSFSLKDNDTLIVGHHNEAQTNPMVLNNVEGYGTLKLHSPYFFVTPPGYGIQFYDAFYHHRNNIRLLPGKVETDIWHEVNFPFEFYAPMKEAGDRLHVSAGEPLITLVPYKKDTKVELNLEPFSQDIFDKQNKNNMINNTVSNDWFDYKKLINEE